MKIGKYDINPLMILLIFLPISIVVEMTHQNPVIIFLCAGISIIPLAGLMGEATEHLAEKAGPGIGGLLNATFGNAAELIIAFFALQKGLYDVVKASITGSIIGNILLVLGLSIFCGGMKYKHQTYSHGASSVGSTLLALSSIALIIPAIYDFIVRDPSQNRHFALSLSISVILIIVYILSLVFSLITHKEIYNGENQSHSDSCDDAHGAPWSTKKSVTVLLVATIGVAIMSEFLIGAVEHTAKTLGMPKVFVGVIIVAMIGNAAEHSAAIWMALKNKMDLAMNIAVGSSIQVALFVAPVLIFCSYMFKPMDLVFTPFEVVSIFLSVWVLHMITNDGECSWIEGILLLGIYIIIGLTFFYLPEKIVF